MSKEPGDPGDLAPPLLYVAMFSVVDSALLTHAMADHLAWVAARQAEGRIVLAGPLSAEGASLAGLTVVRANNSEAARTMLLDDPFVRRGAMRFALAEWTVLAGTHQSLLRQPDPAMPAAV